MRKRVVLFIFFGFTTLSLVFIILSSQEIATIIEKVHPNAYNKSPARELWETTLGKKLSLLKEKVSWCNIRGGRRVQISMWYEKPPRYTCYFPYSDRGKSCHNSNDCEGECIIISPAIDYKTYFYPSQDVTLKEFNCSGSTSYETWKTPNPEKIYETYECEKNSFKAQCAAFDWDRFNQWTLNDNEINYLMAGEAI